MQNKIILLRDVYADLLYEKNLYVTNSKESEECDYILRTEYPDHLNTTFFEVKREDVKFFVNKNRKRPSFNKKFMDNLDQIWQYKKFAQNPFNANEIKDKIGYATNNFNFVMVAGRLEEKEEMKEIFEEKMKDHYKEIIVQTFEELSQINVNYFDKFKRLQI